MVARLSGLSEIDPLASRLRAVKRGRAAFVAGRSIDELPLPRRGPRVSRVLALLLTTQVLISSSAQPAPGSSLHLTLGIDRRLSCPVNALLEKAVRLRLPAVRIALEGPIRSGDLVASLQRFGGDGWRFEVKRPDGSVEMSREFGAMPCPLIADTSALILERYLSGIDWSGRSVGLAPLPPLEPSPRTADIPRPPSSPVVPPPAAPPPVALEEQVPLDAGPERPTDAGRPIEPPVPVAGTISTRSESDAGISPPARPHPLDEPALTALTLSLGGGAWAGVPWEVSGALSGQLGVRVLRRFHLSLLFVGAPSTVRSVTYLNEFRGTLALQSFAGLATFSVCTTGAGLSACGGLLGGARVTTARATGPTTGPRLFATTSSLAALPQLGLYGKVSAPLYGRFSLSADLMIGAPLGRASFTIQGISAAGYATPRVDFSGLLYVGLQLF